jgi:hypothetical protein
MRPSSGPGSIPAAAADRRDRARAEPSRCPARAVGKTSRASAKRSSIMSADAVGLIPRAAITLDRYGHLLPGNETPARDLLDTYLRLTPLTPGLCRAPQCELRWTSFPCYSRRGVGGMSSSPPTSARP